MDIVQKGAAIGANSPIADKRQIDAIEREAERLSDAKAAAEPEREVEYWEALVNMRFDIGSERCSLILRDKIEIGKGCDALFQFNLHLSPLLFKPHYKEAVTYKVGDRFSSSELDCEYTLTSFTLNQKRYILLAGDDGGYYEEPIVFTGNLSSITPAEFAAICGGAENVKLFTKILNNRIIELKIGYDPSPEAE